MRSPSSVFCSVSEHLPPARRQPFPAPNTCVPGQEAAISSRVGNSSAQTVGAQAFRTLEFRLFEHKIGIFVRFLPSEPPFWGISSTKSRFLCAFALRNPHFRAFRAQNQGFCALLPSETTIFRHFEHKMVLRQISCYQVKQV